MYELHPEVTERIKLVEYHVNTPMSSYGQTVEPMYQVIPDLVKQFSGRASDSCWGANVSLDFKFNRTQGVATGVYEDTTRVNSIIAAANLDEVAPVSVIIASSWDASTRTISGTVSALFDTPVDSGNYRIGMFVIEDSVTGPIPNYRQYDDKYIPQFYTDNYGFPAVHRAEVLSGNTSIWGESGVIPQQPISGVHYSTDFSYTVPDLYYDVVPNPEKLELVAFVTKKPAFPVPSGAKGILNCSWREFLDTSSVAIEKGTRSSVKAPIAVTAISNGLRVALPESGNYRINAYSVSGREIASQSVVASKGNTHTDISLEYTGMLILRIAGPQGEHAIAVPSISR